jgi:hypothetical protein
VNYRLGDDNDNSFFDNEDYNSNNPNLDNEDYNEDNDKPSLDNEGCDEKNENTDIETESDCSKTSAYTCTSEENDELTDDDDEFEESEMINITDGTVNTMFVNCNFDIIIIIIYFR